MNVIKKNKYYKIYNSYINIERRNAATSHYQ